MAAEKADAVAGALSTAATDTKPLPRILIVDSDADAAEALERLLQALGPDEIRIADSGKAALALAAEYLPAIVLMDLELPDMSAYDVARLLSQHAELQNLRLVALTRDGAHSGREQARESGFERYLVKPVASAALEGLLASRP